MQRQGVIEHRLIGLRLAHTLHAGNRGGLGGQLIGHVDDQRVGDGFGAVEDFDAQVLELFADLPLLATKLRLPGPRDVAIHFDALAGALPLLGNVFGDRISGQFDDVTLGARGEYREPKYEKPFVTHVFRISPSKSSLP